MPQLAHVCSVYAVHNAHNCIQNVFLYYQIIMTIITWVDEITFPVKSGPFHVEHRELCIFSNSIMA